MTALLVVALVLPWLLAAALGWILFQFLDRPGARAPAARHFLDDLGQHVLLLDGELAADGEVMESPGPPGRRHVETGDVAAGAAAVSGGRH